MIYNLSNEIESKRALTRLEHLVNKKKTVEIIEKSPKRSVSQNAYQHAIFASFAIEFGYTLREVKQVIFKRIVNKSIFQSEFKDKISGESIRDYRSTSELSKEENTLAIERFRNYSSINGFYIFSPEEFIENRSYIMQEISRNKEFI